MGTRKFNINDTNESIAECLNMEKIITQQRKDSIIFLSITFLITIASYFYGIKEAAIIGTIFMVIHMFIFKLFYDFLYHSRISFCKEGIIMNWSLLENITQNQPL